MKKKPGPEEVARQLRKPEDKFGIQIAEQLNSSNVQITAYIYSCMQAQKGEKIMEIGFGNGKLMPLLLDEAPDIFLNGIDYSETMVKEANKHLRKYIDRQQLELKLAATISIPYEENSFDKICTINTLYFWDKPLEEAREVLRVLKPGGHLYIGIRPKAEARNLEVTKYGFTLYDPEEAADLLLMAGFSDVNFTLQQDPPVMHDGKEYVLNSCCVSGRK